MVRSPGEQKSRSMFAPKMMHHMSEDKSSYVNMFYSLDKRQIDQLIYKVSKPIIYGVAKRAVNGRAVSAEDLEYVSNFFTYAMAGLITEWIFGGMNMDNVDKELSKQFTIMDGIMEFTINKFVQ